MATPAPGGAAAAPPPSPPAGRARFRVKFSDVVLALPRGAAAAHPASLSFSFDSFWTAETTVTAPPDTASADAGAETRHPLAFVNYANNSSKARRLDAPSSELRFIYETSLVSKLHRKFLVLTLTMPRPPAADDPDEPPQPDDRAGAGHPRRDAMSPESSPESPPSSSPPHQPHESHKSHKSHQSQPTISTTAIISIDALARGCQRVALTFPDPRSPGAPCLGTVHFRVSVLHFERVQARLYDVKVADYPEKHIHDVKLLFIELGYRPSVEGHNNPTEKSSDAEPRFTKLPTLEKFCSLQEMLHGGAAPTDLRIFFSLHRQVARTRTEEIGLGALPIHMLFSRVENGVMEEPTKFKVPLAGYKGLVKGKILLCNIPQWSQLGGDDLVNRDGVITPTHVDLNSRKLLPWMRLPRSNSSSRRTNAPSPSVRAFASPSLPPLAQMMPSGPSAILAPEHALHPSSGALPVAPSAMWPDGVAQLSESPMMLPPHIMPAPVPPPSARGPDMPTGHKRRVSVPDFGAELAAGAGVGVDSNAPYGAGAIGGLGAGFGMDSSSGIGGDFRVAARTSPPSGFGPLQQTSFTEQNAFEHERELQRDYQRQREDSQRSAYYSAESMPLAPPSAHLLGFDPSMLQQSGPPGAMDGGYVTPEPMPVMGGAKSSKSIGSSTTGYQSSSDEPAAALSGQAPMPTGVHGEWLAVHDASSDRFYFANSVTNESLWLPPLWEHQFDGDGRPFFVDHDNKTTQREFPVEESRAYKLSVSNGNAH